MDMERWMADREHRNWLQRRELARTLPSAPNRLSDRELADRKRREELIDRFGSDDE